MENGQPSSGNRFWKISIVNVLVGIVAVSCFLIAIAVGVSLSRLDHTASDRAVCANNLRFIQIAKQAWALDAKAPANATPTWNDLKPYMPGRMTTLPPECLSGGVYTIGNLQAAPTCTVKGHVLE